MKIKLIAGLIVIVLLFGLLGVRVIKPSQVGVVTTLGKITGVAESGVTWVAPLISKVTKIDTSTKTVEGVYETSTRDMQTTTEYVTTLYSVDVSKVMDLYRNFLGNHQTSLIAPALATTVQDGVSTVSISELVSNRVELAASMTENARTMLEPYGINIVTMQITNHDFSDEYESAITAKIVAQEKVKTAEYARQEAEIQAETNKILSQTYDDNMKSKMFLEKWDGKMPLYMSGDNEMMNMLLPSGN